MAEPQDWVVIERGADCRVLTEAPPTLVVAVRTVAGALPDPLTDRELDAKTRVARILRKLDAPTRVAAAPKARDMGIF